MNRNKIHLTLTQLCFLSVAALLLSLILASPLSAAPIQQEDQAPEIVASWQGDHGRGYALYRPSGFYSDFSQTGIIWWDTAINGKPSCPVATGENWEDDGTTIRVKAYSNALPHTVESQNCDALAATTRANVVRYGQALYYFVNGKPSRKAISSGSDSTAAPLVNAPQLTENQSAVLAVNTQGQLLWADHVDPSQFDESPGASTFYRMPADDSAPAEPLFTQPNVGPVVKLETMRYRTNSLNLSTFAWLTAGGELYRYQPVGENVVKLADDIVDFAVHVYETANGTPDSVILAVTDAPGPVTLTSPESKVLRIDPVSGAIQELVVDIPRKEKEKSQFLSVAVDSAQRTPKAVNLYITEELWSCKDGPCKYTTGARIYRRWLFPEDKGGSCVDAFCLHLDSADGGYQLASDDQWLYFVRGDNLYRYPTGAPGIEIDVAATHLEVNQGMQNLQNDFPLVAEHATVVRGYADLLVNSTTTAGIQFTARLKGTLDGKPLPGSPLLPVADVTVDGTSSLAAQRADKDKTYVFVLPESWVQNQYGGAQGADNPSRLALELTVNPNTAVSETSYDNNTVSVEIDVFQREATCFVSVPVHTQAPAPNAVPFDIVTKLTYAQKFLPVSDMKLWLFHPSLIDGPAGDAADIFDPDINLLSDGGTPFVLAETDTAGNAVFTDGPALEALKLLASLSSWPCPDNTHWMGVVHEDTFWGNVGGRASGDHTFMLKLAPDTGGTLAHELAHNFGRSHTNCGDFPPAEQNFDAVGMGNGAPLGLSVQYDPCTLGPTDLNDPATYVGFDTFAMDVRTPADYSDLMSYSHNIGIPKWSSMLAWYWMFNNERLRPVDPAGLVQAAGFTVDDEVLLVQGAIAADGASGELRHTLRMDTAAAPAAQITHSLRAAAQRTPSSYEIRLLDSNGLTLQATAAITTETTDYDDANQPMTFIQYVPFPAQTARVQLVANDQVLAEQMASTNQPSIELRNVSVNADDAHVDVAWDATDADGDPLAVTLFYSSDDGATWRVLAQGLSSQDKARLSTGNLPATRQARLRVLVHDGFHSTTATSTAFTIADHPPIPTIDGIVDGARVSFADAPIVLGFAYDPDEGSLDAEALAWILDGPTSRTGDGDQFDLRQLVPGAYTLTLTATDSTGLTAETSVSFDVLPLAVQDAPAPVLDGLCLDEGYADATRVEFPRGRLAMEEGRWPYVRLLHAEGSLYVCFNDQGYADGRKPRLVGFQVDADGNSGAEPQGDDIGFFVDENGLGTQTSPFFGVMAPSPSPAAGFEVAVYPSVTIWSAEFRIEDVLVGGWEHGARLLFKHEITDLYNEEANWPGTGRHSIPETWAEAYFGTPPTPPNQPPVANAGTDVQIQVTEPMTLYLSGGLSYDPDNDRLRYRWRQVGGPTVRLDDPDGENVSFPVEPVREVTDLHFELIVNDGEVDSPPDAFMWRLLPADDTMPENYAVYLPFLMRQR